MRRRSLLKRFSVFFGSELIFLFRTRSLVLRIFGLAHTHPTVVLSLGVVVAEHFYDGAWDLRRKCAEGRREALSEKKEKQGGGDAKEAEGVDPDCFGRSLYG